MVCRGAGFGARVDPGVAAMDAIKLRGRFRVGWSRKLQWQGAWGGCGQEGMGWVGAMGGG